MNERVDKLTSERFNDGRTSERTNKRNERRNERMNERVNELIKSAVYYFFCLACCKGKRQCTTSTS